ncbi:MAG: hypothetical protein R3293_04615 [Candidatus Promineifilaceae bacterium]|nr:hypothetical protein [Candidatus Promineifilaceae bacterium]
MKIRILSAADVVQALPMADAIEGMKEAYAQLSTGKAIVPLRSRIDVPAEGATLVMPGYLQQGDSIAVKTVSVFPNNGSRGIPIIHAMVTVLDAKTGMPTALLEGAALTAIRTGAASGAATDVLAPKDAQTAAIFGSGVQARTQLEAVCTVRRIKEVRVYSIDRNQAEQFAQEMAGRGPIPTAVNAVEDPDTAVHGADIVCTATTSSTPVFNGSLLQPGTHVNGVGSFLPTMQEVDLMTIQRALVVVDSRPAVWEEAGDLIVPLQNGEITKDHVHAELGEIIAGKRTGRQDSEQITFFKSVGVAVQDVAAAGIALKNAQAQDLGTLMNF